MSSMLDRFRLDGQVAIITGSGRGIGAACALAFADAGADVVLSARSLAELEETAARVRARGRRALVVPCDVMEAAQRDALVARAVQEFGRLDILVNNAGTQHRGPIESHPPARWREVFALNLDAAFHTIRAALLGMRERGWGRLVNIASVYGLVGGVDRSSYVASKHALVGLTKAVALETAGQPITCNAVCPGDVSTRIFYRNAKLMAEREGISREEAQRRIAATNMPSGQVVSPEQIASLVAYLCSDAASEVRGAAWPMDGAWVAR